MIRTPAVFLGRLLFRSPESPDIFLQFVTIELPVSINPNRPELSISGLGSIKVFKNQGWESEQGRSGKPATIEGTIASPVCLPPVFLRNPLLEGEFQKRSVGKAVRVFERKLSPRRFLKGSKERRGVVGFAWFNSAWERFESSPSVKNKVWVAEILT